MTHAMQLVADSGSRGSRRTATGFRAALEELYGEEGVYDVRQRLAPAADAAIFDPRWVTEKWVAEEHLLAFMDAVFCGPCARNRRSFNDWSVLQVQRGIGRVKAAMIKAATPEQLASRLEALWREDHTHGVVTVQLRPRKAVITLREHEYADHLLARSVLTESGRALLAATSFAQNVRGSFEVPGGSTLVLTFSWT